MRPSCSELMVQVDGDNLTKSKGLPYELYRLCHSVQFPVSVRERVMVRFAHNEYAF